MSEYDKVAGIIEDTLRIVSPSQDARPLNHDNDIFMAGYRSALKDLLYTVNCYRVGLNVTMVPDTNMVVIDNLPMGKPSKNVVIADLQTPATERQRQLQCDCGCGFSYGQCLWDRNK